MTRLMMTMLTFVSSLVGVAGDMPASAEPVYRPTFKQIQGWWANAEDNAAFMRHAVFDSYSCGANTHRPKHVWCWLNARDDSGDGAPYMLTISIDRVDHHATQMGSDWQGYFNVVSIFGGGHRRATFKVIVTMDVP